MSSLGAQDMAFLRNEQVRQFEDEGFLLVRGLIDVDRVLRPIIEEYCDVLDCLAHELHAAGRIGSTYDDLAFGPRFTQIIID